MDYIEPDPPLVAPGYLQVGAGGIGAAPDATDAEIARLRADGQNLTKLCIIAAKLKDENDDLRARVAALEIGMRRLPAEPASVTWCSPDATDAWVSFWREAIETQERAGLSTVDPRSEALARAVAADKPLDAYGRRS